MVMSSNSKERAATPTVAALLRDENASYLPGTRLAHVHGDTPAAVEILAINQLVLILMGGGYVGMEVGAVVGLGINGAPVGAVVGLRLHCWSSVSRWAAVKHQSRSESCEHFSARSAQARASRYCEPEAWSRAPLCTIS